MPRIRTPRSTADHQPAGDAVPASPATPRRARRSSRDADGLTPDDWSLQQNIAFHMASVIFRMDQDLRDTILRGLDLTYAHYRVLQVLFEADGQQIGDIARAIVVRQPVLSRVITQMEERDLVRRQADADDSRIMRVYLTAAGRASYREAWPPAHALMERSFSVLSAEERATLADLMRRVDRHVNH